MMLIDKNLKTQARTSLKALKELFDLKDETDEIAPGELTSKLLYHQQLSRTPQRQEQKKMPQPQNQS